MDEQQATTGGGSPDAVLDEAVLTFPDGIPGFAEANRFVLSDLVEDGAFQLLTSMDVDGLELVVATPWLFFADYAPEISDADQRELGVEVEGDVLLFCAVTLPEDEGPPTMNLLGPFVVNRHTRIGRQVVLESDEPVRAPLVLG